MRSRQQGVSMIEVLVSIVIVAIGIMGLTALQGVSMKNTTSANLRSTASMLARDMADRMRANQTALLSGKYDSLTGTPTNPDCEANTCSSDNVAKYDYWRWNQDVANTLPMGKGVVCLDSTPIDGTSPADHGCDLVKGSVKDVSTALPDASEQIKTWVVKVWWDDNRTGTPRLFQMEVNP